jgi:hypothetical protein
VPNIEWITPDDGQGSCPKHVELCTRINLEISASLDFIERKDKEICLKGSFIIFSEDKILLR